MDIDSREYIFANELMTSVMELYNIKWKLDKTPLYVKLSPFTPVVKKAIGYIWREKSEFIEDLFNTVLEMGTINMRNYKAAVDFASHLVTEAEYDEIELLRFCVIASGYASLFYSKGLRNVHNECIQSIYNVIVSFRTKNEFTDESWADIEILGEAYSAEPPASKDSSNAASASFSQATKSCNSDNFLQIHVRSRKVDNKYASKTLQIKIKSPMKKGDRNDSDSLNGHSMKRKGKNGSSKLEKNKSPKETITNRKNVDETIAEKRVRKKIIPTKMTTKNPAKTEDVRHEIAASKYITAEIDEGKDDDEKISKQQCKAIIVEPSKFKHKNVAAKFKDCNYAETINEFVKFATGNNAVKKSEANDYGEKKNKETREEINKDKYNKVKSETKNIGEEVSYETKKIEKIKQEMDTVLKTYNVDEVVNETTNRTQIIKTKNLKKKKHRRIKSKNKTIKAGEGTWHEGAGKAISEANDSIKETIEIDYSSGKTSEANNTYTEAARTHKFAKSAEETVKKLKKVPRSAVILKEKKFGRIKIKTKRAKRIKNKTNENMFKVPNVVPAVKQVSKNSDETDNVALDSAIITDLKNVPNRKNTKFAEIKYLTEDMHNVKSSAEVLETTVTKKDVHSTKHDKLDRPKCKTFSETTNEYQKFEKDGENDSEKVKASHKDIAKKIKLPKYKTKKFKGKSHKGKKVKRIKPKVKKAEIIIDSSDDSVTAINPVAEHLAEATKYSSEKTSKKVKVIEKKAKKKSKKKKSKKLKETICSLDEYIDVVTIDEAVEVANKNLVTKKRKHNTKLVKNVKNTCKTSIGEFSRPRRRSKREKIANHLVVDLTEEAHQIPSSNEIEPKRKDSNLRNPGCEISNLIKVSEHENSKDIFQNKSQEKDSPTITDNQESENKNPKYESQTSDFKEVELKMPEACNIIPSRKSTSGTATKHGKLIRNPNHKRRKTH